MHVAHVLATGHRGRPRAGRRREPAAALRAHALGLERCARGAARAPARKADDATRVAARLPPLPRGQRDVLRARLARAPPDARRAAAPATSRRADARRTIGRIRSTAATCIRSADKSSCTMYRFKSKADGDLIMMEPVGDADPAHRRPRARGPGNHRARGDAAPRSRALEQAIAAADAARDAPSAPDRRRRHAAGGATAVGLRPARLAAARDDAALARRARRHRLGRLTPSPAPPHAVLHEEAVMKLWSDSWPQRRAHPAALRVRPARRCGGVDLLRQRQPAPGLERAALGNAVAGR